MLRIWEGKGDKYRETPISEPLATKPEAVAYRNDRDPDEPVHSVVSTRFFSSPESSIGAGCGTKVNCKS